jgi:ribosomal protein L7/L12
MRIVTIKVITESAYQVTDAEYDLVSTLYNRAEPMKVTAVKFMRAQHGVSLKEAKDICDEIGRATTGGAWGHPMRE